jgi:hypothetical protein
MAIIEPSIVVLTTTEPISSGRSRARGTRVKAFVASGPQH